MANGSVTRRALASHNRGKKHQSALRRIERDRIEEAAFRDTLWELESAREKRQYYHLLLMSIVATRLRTQYESIEDARLIWLLESQTLLSRLDSPLVESAILESTMKYVAVTNIRSIARDSHLLLELISEHLE